MTNKEDSKTSPDPNGTVAPNQGALASNGHNDAAGDNSGTVVDEVFVGNDDTNADGAEVATIGKTVEIDDRAAGDRRYKKGLHVIYLKRPPGCLCLNPQSAVGPARSLIYFYLLRSIFYLSFDELLVALHSTTSPLSFNDPP